MKKIWKVLIIFEIIVFLLFFVSWSVYEDKWIKEKFIEEKDNFSNYGIYQPIISKVNSTTGCIYNVGIKINPDKIAKNNENMYKLPN